MLILIVGAGPTGLMLALRLAHHGVPFRIVERNGGPGQASRAMAVQARTLEFYDQLGLADEVVSRGVKVLSGHFREDGREVAQLPLSRMGEAVTPFPFVLCWPQDDQERFLVDALAARGAHVEWGVTLQGFEQTETGVHATLRRADGGEERCEAAYLCGCDGAHTTVRPALGIGFPGGTYEQLFYVADVQIDAPLVGQMVMGIGPKTLALKLPVRSSGMWRLIGVVPQHLHDQPNVTFEDVRASAEELVDVTVGAVNWFSTYRVHHRVADHFRDRRVFLCGDAGHLHSPAGGQGMNTGIGDAVNLSWKLADVMQGRCAESLLDSYEPERIVFARWLVKTTDRAFQGMVGEGWGSRFLRGWIIPHLLPALAGVGSIRERFFATLSQTAIHYRDSALGEGHAGRVHAGDRLPWTGENYRSLRDLGWRVHVHGASDAPLDAAAAALGAPVDVFAWGERAASCGYARDAAYLVRPDGHVAFAAQSDRGAALAQYAARIGLRAAPSPVG